MASLVEGSSGDQPGSPLLLLVVAGQVAMDGPVDEVELFLVEKHEDNCEALSEAIGTVERPPNVKIRGPRCSSFVVGGSGRHQTRGAGIQARAEDDATWSMPSSRAAVRMSSA